MKKQNICKLIASGEQDALRMIHLVYERNSPHIGTWAVNAWPVMHLVTNGEAVLHSCDRKWSIGVGSIFFTFEGMPYNFDEDRDFEYCYIGFSGGRSDRLFQRFGITSVCCVFDGYEGLIPIWMDHLARATDENSDLLSESLLLYTFSQLQANRKSGNDLVSFVLMYLDDHFSESDLTLSRVAEAAGYHEKYLSHVFKKRFGMGFSEYLRVRRLKYAVLLIENGVTSVKNVAALSGFSDALYFSKVFTETMGVSPSKYKKKETKV